MERTLIYRRCLDPKLPDLRDLLMSILNTHFIPMFCLIFSSSMIYISVIMLYFPNFVIRSTIEWKRVKSKKNR